MLNNFKDLNVVGVDETGVGDYLTPLVACACFVPKENIDKLIKLGIVDSKKISDKKILDLSSKIKKLLIFRTRHLTQKGYNKLNKSFNANELKMLLHMGAINDIEEIVKDLDLIIIDKFSTPSSIKKYQENLLRSSLDVKPIKSEYNLIEKAESVHVSVAAASILAREKLINLMEIQNKKWKTKFPLGTNKIVENFAKDFIKKHGSQVLEEIAKVSFKTTKKILEN